MAELPKSLQPFLGKGPKGFVVFTALSALQRLLGVIVLPLVAEALPVAEYGQIAIVMTATVLFSTVLSFGMESWVFRAHFLHGEALSEDYLAVVGLSLRASAPLVGLTVGAVVWTAVRAGVVGDERFGAALAIALVGAGFVAPVGPFSQARLRAQQRFSPFAVLVLSFVLVSAAAKLLLVGALGLGLIGWVLADLAGSVVAYLMSWLIVPLPTRPRRDAVRPALTVAFRFGLPLLPHVLLFQVLLQGDRFVLAGAVSDADIGRYAVAQQAMWVFAVVLMEFTRAIMPSYARHATGIRTESLRHLVSQQLTVAPALATLALVIAPLAVSVLLPDTYTPERAVYPWLAIAVVLVGLYSIPVNLLVLVEGRSRQVWIGTTVAVAVNLTLVWALAPRIGTLAAAVGSALGYLTLTVAMVLIELRNEALLRRCFPSRGLGAPVGAAMSLALATIALSFSPDVRVALATVSVVTAAVAVVYARRQASLSAGVTRHTRP